MANRRTSPLLPPAAPARSAALQPAPTSAALASDPSPTPTGRPEGPNYVRASLLSAAAALLALTPLPAAQLATPPAAHAPQITQPAQPPPSELPKLVAQLAAQPALAAADCEKLARETLTHGQSVRQSGQPVKPGIVQDGLAAVDRGEALDAKAADWPELRSQLQALLQPPPPQDQKQDEKKKDEQKQEEKKQDQQQDQKQDDQQKSEEQKKQEQQQKSEEQKRQEQQNQPAQPQQAEPPKDKDTQKIGGEKPEDDERKEHPELAMPLQKLDQVREKDSPAELFELLHENEPKSPDQPKKDW